MILDVNGHDPKKTHQQILPYTFKMMLTGKLCITNTRGQTLLVTRTQVINILAREDLDVHRRRMYEAALEVFKKDDPKPEVQ